MPVHIIVCVKSVVRAAPGGVAQRTPDNSELNLFDRPALEAALQTRDALGGVVTALSMGPKVSIEALSEARSMGVDRGVLICDAALAGSDTLVTARVLAAAIDRLAPYDLLLFGTRSADSDTGQVGAQTATVLQLPMVSGVNHLQRQDEGWNLRRIMDDWEEQWQVDSPAALTVHPRAFTPRSIGLTGISQALGQPNIECWTLEQLGIDRGAVGLSGSPTRVARMQQIQRSRSCNLISGEPSDQVEALVEQLIKLGVMGS